MFFSLYDYYFIILLIFVLQIHCIISLAVMKYFVKDCTIRVAWRIVKESKFRLSRSAGSGTNFVGQELLAELKQTAPIQYMQSPLPSSLCFNFGLEKEHTRKNWPVILVTANIELPRLYICVLLDVREPWRGYPSADFAAVCADACVNSVALLLVLGICLIRFSLCLITTFTISKKKKPFISLHLGIPLTSNFFGFNKVGQSVPYYINQQTSAPVRRLLLETLAHALVDAADGYWETI
jgi:hypothetical protein